MSILSGIPDGTLEAASYRLIAGAYPNAGNTSISRAASRISQEIRQCLAVGQVTEHDADHLAAELQEIFGPGPAGAPADAFA